MGLLRHNKKSEALRKAVVNNDLITARALLFDNVVLDRRSNAFNYACYCGYKEMVVLLIQNGVFEGPESYTKYADFPVHMYTMLKMFENPKTRKLAELLYY